MFFWRGAATIDVQSQVTWVSCITLWQNPERINVNHAQIKLLRLRKTDAAQNGTSTTKRKPPMRRIATPNDNDLSPLKCLQSVVISPAKGGPQTGA
jgi:hypothetical protein